MVYSNDHYDLRVVTTKNKFGGRRTFGPVRDNSRNESVTERDGIANFLGRIKMFPLIYAIYSDMKKLENYLRNMEGRLVLTEKLEAVM